MSTTNARQWPTYVTSPVGVTDLRVRNGRVYGGSGDGTGHAAARDALAEQRDARRERRRARLSVPPAVADPDSQYGREYVRELDKAATAYLKRRGAKPQRGYTRADREAFQGAEVAPLEPGRTLERGGNRPVDVRVHGTRPSTRL